MKTYMPRGGETIEKTVHNMIAMANDMRDYVMAAFNDILLRADQTNDPEVSARLILDYYYSCRSKPLTDLDKFVALYKEFGITCVVNTNTEDGTQYIKLIYDDAHSDEENTESPLFEGYFGFYSQIEFDAHGHFLKQGFWE